MNQEEKTRIETPADRSVEENSLRDQLDTLIDGSPAGREKAVSLLLKADLADFPEQVQKLLSDSNLLQEFKGELILAMIRQRVNHSFTMDKDGMEYQFNPSLLDDPDQQKTVNEVRALFSERLGQGTSLSARFAGQLLDQEILEMLPLDLEGCSAEDIAASLIRLVSENIKNDTVWKDYKEKYVSGDVHDFPLRIEMRGKY